MTLDFYDTFTRVEATTLGVSDSGHTWSSTRFSTNRTNLIPNPSFEVNTTGWATVGGSLVKSSVQADTGTSSGLFTATAGGAAGTRYALVNTVTAVAGETFSGSVRVRMSTATSRSLTVRIRYVTSGGVFLAESTSSTTPITNGAWTTLSVNGAAAPATTARADLYIRDNDATIVAADAWFIDSAIMEKAASAGSYFDGAVNGGSWTGTAHASTSTLPVYVVDTGQSVDGSSGVISVAAVSTAYRATVVGVDEADLDITARFALPSDPVGGPLYLKLLSRFSGVANLYHSALTQVNVDGTTSVFFQNGTTTTATGSAEDWTGQSVINVRYRIAGVSARVKVWYGETTEPSNWSLSATVTTLNASGTFGIEVSGHASLTPIPYDVQIDAITSATVELGSTLFDSFTRTTSLSLGAADSDHTYTVISGATSKLSTNGTQGVFTLNDDGNIVVATVPVTLSDFRVQFKQTIQAAPPDTTAFGFLLRYTDANNYIFFSATYSAASSLTVDVQKVIAGTPTTVLTHTVGVITPGDFYEMMCEVSGNKVRMKVWADSSSEPGSWTAETTDGALPDPGVVGWRAGRGATAGTAVVLVDDLSLRDVIPTITVEYVDNTESPGVRITLTNGDVYPRIRVSRLHIENRFAPATVRGLDVVPIPSPLASANDYEIPLDEDFNYRVDALDEELNVVTTAFSDTVSVPVPYHRVLVRSVGQPTLSQRIQITAFPSFSQQLRILQEAKILGKSRPVVLFDVMEGMTGEFECMSTLDQNDPIGWKLRELIRDGQPLMFQSVNRVTGIEDFYFVAEGVTVVRKETVHPSREPRFIYQVQFKEVDRPPTDSESLGFFSWETLEDVVHPDWQSVKDTFSSWLAVLNFTNRTPL